MSQLYDNANFYLNLNKHFNVHEAYGIDLLLNLNLICLVFCLYIPKYTFRELVKGNKIFMIYDLFKNFYNVQ